MWSRRAARLRRHRHEARLPFGERARLVHHERRNLLEQLERFGVPEQHAGFCAAAGAHHDRHRRREPERARARDDEHGDRVDQRVGEPRLGPDDRPRDERRRCRDDHDSGTNHAATVSASTLNRRARSLRLADHAHDLREQRVRADALRFHHERARAIDSPAGHRDRPALSRQESARRSPSIRRCCRALDDDAVDRNALARAHAQTILHMTHRRAGRLARFHPDRCAARFSARGRAGCGSRRSVRLRARNSSTWPSSTRTTMAAAGSK